MNGLEKLTAMDELREPFEAYIEEIKAVAVETAEQYEAAAFGLKKLKTWQSDITAYFEPERKKTYDAYTAVNNVKGFYLNKAEDVEKVIKSKMAKFQLAEQEKIRNAQIEAAQKEAEARRELANSLPTADSPAVVSDVTIPAVPEATKVSGISVRKTWKYEITDMSAIKPVFFKLDEAMVSKVVKDYGPDAVAMVGGIRVIEDVVIGSGRG